MKLHDDMTIDIALAMMQAHTSAPHIESRIVLQCVGCDEQVSPRDAACCICGGFVCSACRRVEEEGVCNHEPIDLCDDDEDDEAH